MTLAKEGVLVLAELATYALVLAFLPLVLAFLPLVLAGAVACGVLDFARMWWARR